LALGIEDLHVARICPGAAEPALTASAYHGQQAAEKLIKGLLVLADVPFTKMHILRRLGLLAEPHYPSYAPLLAATYPFTPWAFDFRYPGTDPEPPDGPDRSTLQEAMSIIEQLVVCLRVHMAPDPAPYPAISLHWQVGTIEEAVVKAKTMKANA
jgi:HEPN domain-containing protein